MHSSVSSTEADGRCKISYLLLILLTHLSCHRQDKSDWAELGRALATSSSCSVAVVNYRLSTRGADNTIVHPAHAEDVLRFLNFALDWEGPDGVRLYNPSHIYLIGHSCAAHMVSSILLAPPSEYAPLLATITPSRRLLQAIRGAVLSGGGYDLDHLIRQNPAHRQLYVEPGMGRMQSYAPYNIYTYKLRKDGEHIKWLVVHSSGDKVVTRADNEAIFHRLQNLVEETGSRGNVQGYWELISGHMDYLREGEFPRAVGSFVSAIEQDTVGR